MVKLSGVLNEARKTTVDMRKEGLGLFIASRGDSKRICIVDFQKISGMINMEDLDDAFFDPSVLFRKAVIAGISFSIKKLYVQVETVFSKQGYGPLLYYIAAKFHPKLAIGSDFSISEDARKVWRKFSENPNIARKIKPWYMNDGRYEPELAESEFGEDTFLAYYYFLDKNLKVDKLVSAYESGKASLIGSAEALLQEHPDNDDLLSFCRMLESKFDESMLSASKYNFGRIYNNGAKR